MPRKKHKPEEIVAKLRQAAAHFFHFYFIPGENVRLKILSAIISFPFLFR